VLFSKPILLAGGRIAQIGAESQFSAFGAIPVIGWPARSASERTTGFLATLTRPRPHDRHVLLGAYWPRGGPAPSVDGLRYPEA